MLWILGQKVFRKLFFSIHSNKVWQQCFFILEHCFQFSNSGELDFHLMCTSSLGNLLKRMALTFTLNWLFCTNFVMSGVSQVLQNTLKTSKFNIWICANAKHYISMYKSSSAQTSFSDYPKDYIVLLLADYHPFTIDSQSCKMLKTLVLMQ